MPSLSSMCAATWVRVGVRVRVRVRDRFRDRVRVWDRDRDRDRGRDRVSSSTGGDLLRALRVLHRLVRVTVGV